MCLVSLELPFSSAHGAVRIVAFAFRPLLDAVDMECVCTLACDDGAVVAWYAAHRAARVEELAADSARVVRFAVPSPTRDEVHRLQRNWHDYMCSAPQWCLWQFAHAGSQ
jgi:hypothetical protein